MFDCVIPTRNGRNGYIYTEKGILKIRNSEHKNSNKPLDENCDCYTCRNFTRGYIHHLDRCNEMLASTLMTICNLSHFHKLMKDIRDSLEENKFEEFVEYFYDMSELKKAKTLGVLSERSSSTNIFSIYYAFSFFPFVYFVTIRPQQKEKRNMKHWYQIFKKEMRL